MKANIDSRQIVSKRSLLSKVSRSLGITRLRILPRIILTLALPITGLLGASGYVATVKYHESSKLADVRELAQIAPNISALVHEMQKERGVSAGYIGSKGEGTGIVFDLVGDLSPLRIIANMASHSFHPS